MGETTIADLGNERGGCREEHEWWQWFSVVADIELLEVVECPGVERALQLGVGAEAEEAESVGGARVLGDDLGDGRGEDEGGAGVDTATSFSMASG
jgi:hypothetical protein